MRIYDFHTFRREPPEGGSTWIRNSVLILSGIVSVILAWTVRWTSDDAFISFRYARNFANGLGLVFNEGEKVEGFTNFSWTLLMAIPHFAGIDVVSFAYVTGILFYILSFFFISRISLLLNEKENFVPLAAILFISHKHIRIFATGGLETSLFSFLIIASLYFSILAFKKNDLRKLGISSAFVALASMTRPDGIIFLLMIPSVLILNSGFAGPNFFKNLFKVIWPFILLFVPYWFWRWSYFGFFFPNTYYAKSGGESYWNQGLKYFWLYFSSYYILFVFPLLSLILFVKESKRGKFSVKNKSDKLVSVVILFPAILHILYFTRVGGDFMFSRFYIPSTALLLIAGEYYIRRIWKKSKTVFLIAFLSVIFPRDHYQGHDLPVIDGISEEYKIYKRKDMEKAAGVLKSWAPVFEEFNIRIALGGSQAFFAYYLNAPYAFEASTGLTDRELSHKKIIDSRGLIGHEKKATIQDMRDRNIHLLLNSEQWPAARKYEIVETDSFPGHFRIVAYDRRAIAGLDKIKEIHYMKFEHYLNDYIRNIEKYPSEKIRVDYKEFKRYYFDFNNDEKEKLLLSKLKRDV